LWKIVLLLLLPAALPAVFTRVLSVKQAGALEKYTYLAVYNTAYVVPLALIVFLLVCTMGRYRMTEAHGKILNGLNGALMLALGLLAAAPRGADL
jgi:cytochrome c biogenesis protein CcdA